MIFLILPELVIRFGLQKEIGKELNQPVENIIKQKAIFSAKTI